MSSWIHGVDQKHPVFQGPGKVEFKWEEKPSGGYKGQKSKNHPEAIGDNYQTARVQTVDPGKDIMWSSILVNDSGTFQDIPFLESIAEGESGKVLGSLGVARQGRFLYWGFTSSPKNMTAPAKNLFYNCCVYLHSKRNSETVKHCNQPRRNLQNYYDLSQKIAGYEKQAFKHFRNSLVENSAKDWKAEGKFVKEWLEKNLDYLFSGRGEAHINQHYDAYEIDFDAQTLGTPNGRRESLETWMELAAGDDADKKKLAQACLKRYVHENIYPKDGDWKLWYKNMKDKIVFVESIGFFWIEIPKD